MNSLNVFVVLLFCTFSFGDWAWRTSTCYHQAVPTNFTGLNHTGETYVVGLNGYPTAPGAFTQNQYFFYYETAGTCLALANYTLNRVGTINFVSLDNRTGAAPLTWVTKFDVSYITFMGHSLASIAKVKALCPDLPAMQVNIPQKINSTCLGQWFEGAHMCGGTEWNTYQFTGFDLYMGQFGGLTCSSNSVTPLYPSLSQKTFWVNMLNNTPFPTPTPTATPVPTAAATLPNPIGAYSYVACTFAKTIPFLGDLRYNTEIRIGGWTLPFIQTSYFYINTCSGTALWTLTETWQPFPVAPTNVGTFLVKFVPKSAFLVANAQNAADTARSYCTSLTMYAQVPFDVSNIDCPFLTLRSQDSCPVGYNTFAWSSSSSLSLSLGAPRILCGTLGGSLVVPGGSFVFNPKAIPGFKKRKLMKKMKQ